MGLNLLMKNQWNWYFQVWKWQIYEIELWGEEFHFNGGRRKANDNFLYIWRDNNHRYEKC